jgi:4-amino-4-deoxy-L-arabinose transferase-like glycosyltransferase
MIRKTSKLLQYLLLSEPWRRYAVLFVFDLLLRIPVILLVAANPDRAVPLGDPPGYLLLAMNLLTHGVFSSSVEAPFLPELLRTPGYPFFLFLVFRTAGPSMVAVAAVQSLFHAASAVLLCRLGEALFRSAPIGVSAALIWTVAPIPSIFTGILLTEILFTTFFLLTLWLVVEPTPLRTVAGGLFLGLGIWIRPIAVLVWAALLPVFVFRRDWRKTVGRLMLFSATLAAALLPWIARNAVLFGRPSFSVLQGLNLYEYNVPGYLMHRDGLTLVEARTVLDRKFQEYIQEHNLRPANLMEETDVMAAVAMPYVTSDPVRFLWFNALDDLNGLRPGASYFFMFLSPDTLTPDDRTGGNLSPAASHLDRPEILATTILLSVFYGGLFLLSAIGFFLLIRKREWRTILLFALPAFLLMYVPGIDSNARFRIPIEPLLCLLAAAALLEILPALAARLRKKSPSETAPPAG